MMMMTLWDMPLIDAVGFIAALVLAYILGYVDGGGFSTLVAAAEVKQGQDQKEYRKGTEIK